MKESKKIIGRNIFSSLKKQGVVFAPVGVHYCSKVFVSRFESFSVNFAGHAGQVI